MTPVLEQRRQAAAKGHAHRSARGRTRRWLRDTTDTAASRERCAVLLLADLPSHLETVQVFDLLTWVRGLGYHHPRRILRRIGIAEQQPLQRLTEAERRHLAGVLRHGYHDQLELSA